MTNYMLEEGELWNDQPLKKMIKDGLVSTKNLYIFAHDRSPCDYRFMKDDIVVYDKLTTDHVDEMISLAKKGEKVTMIFNKWLSLLRNTEEYFILEAVLIYDGIDVVLESPGELIIPLPLRMRCISRF